MRSKDSKMQRSDAKISAAYLPNIERIYSQKRRSKVKSKSYFEYVSEIAELNNVIDYSAREPSFVTLEQRSLKKVLQKINSDTLDLVQAIKPKKKFDPTSDLRNKQKQFQTSYKMIQNLKHQIKQLQQKMTSILQIQETYHFHQLIDQTKASIQLIKNQNQANHLLMKKIGKQIIYASQKEQISPIQQLTFQKQLFDDRLTHLRNQNTKVNDEIYKINNRILEIQSPSFQAEEYFQKEKNNNRVKFENKKQQDNQRYKLNYLKELRERKEIISSRFQYRYYKILKYIEEQTQKNVQLDKKINKLESELAISKNKLQQLERIYSNQKQKKQKLYLQAEQFLKKMHNDNYETIQNVTIKKQASQVINNPEHYKPLIIDKQVEKQFNDIHI